MGNKPKINSKPIIIENYSEKEIMYYVTKECKKWKEENNELQERVRILTNNNIKLNMELRKFNIENYKTKNELQELKNKYNLNDDQKTNQINSLNNQILKLNNDLKIEKKNLINKDKIINDLNQKLLKNNCQRNISLVESVKNLNNDLKKCIKEKNLLQQKKDDSTKSSQNCNSVQLGLQNQVTNLNNKLGDSENTLKYKNSVINNSDRYISMWRTMSLVFFFLFIVFILLYIFKKGNCENLEKK
tara:strand:+ start:381 stop:1115 length:735 start_codon:yes stop_codon:yes gene_type:complete